MLSKKVDSYNQVEGNILDEIKQFTYPKLHEPKVKGKDWYIHFYAYDPAKGKMARKRIKINHISDKKTELRKYAGGLISRLSKRLESGWNPWVDAESNRAYQSWDEVCDEYVNLLDKQLADGSLRPKTHQDYLYRLKAVRAWNKSNPLPIRYIYQFDRKFVSAFLNYIYIDRDSAPRTRNNYLTWLGIFSAWLVERFYVKVRPTEGIQTLRTGPKSDRRIIADADLLRLKNFLAKENKYFLLACYVIHYCLIRPKEMSYLKLKDISLKNQTITVSGGISKNRKTEVVTLPANVIELMLDLQIFRYPAHFYIFSDRFRPGSEYVNERKFREFWMNTVRKKLNYPSTYKFYSLKDTGITNMLRSCDVLSVRDQARHSSIEMTNIYTPHDIKEANQLIKGYKGVF